MLDQSSSSLHSTGPHHLHLKSYASHKGPWSGSDLRFCSPQPDTSPSCKSTDMWLVCHVECLFSSQLVPVPIHTAWWTEADVCEQLAQGRCNKQSGLDSNLQPTCSNATYWLQIRRHNHYATAPHLNLPFSIYVRELSAVYNGPLLWPFTCTLLK